MTDVDATTEVDLENATPAQLLLLAATLGRTDLIMSAINNGADVNALIPNPKQPDKTLTALHAAVQNRHIDATRALLSIPAHLHIEDSSGQTALSYLPSRSEAPQLHAVFASDLCQKAARTDPSALSHALAAGLDPSQPDSPELGNTPLHWAASFGALECVALLINARVPLDVPNRAGLTPLADSAVSGHAAVVRSLIAAGADPSVRDRHGRLLSDLQLSQPVRSALGLAHAPQPTDSTSFEENSEGPTIPPTPSYTPGGNRLSVSPVDLPEWAVLLWPPPRRFCEGQEAFTVPPVLTISAEACCLPVAQKLVRWLGDSPVIRNADLAVRLVGGGQGGVGEPIAFSAGIFLRIDGDAVEFAEEAYSICVRDFGIDVVASDAAGLFYACATLVNLFNLAMGKVVDPATPFSIPTLSISDCPSVRRRGLYLDLSRKRIPSMDTLKNLISFMARQLKMNQLHLNVAENFDRLKGVSREAMFLHEDIFELDQWCREHFIQLIPVLNRQTMSSKGEEAAQNGASTDTKEQRGEGTDMDEEMLFDEFLPLFNSEQVNLGNVGYTDSDAPVTDFAKLRSLLRRLRSRGKKTLHLFGKRVVNVLANEALAPSALPELPARTVMIVEADGTPHESLTSSCLLLRRHGLPFYTCASSCLGDSIAGRLSACLNQTYDAVTTATAQGAVGTILKDSSMCHPFGTLVLLYQSLLPFGGAAWNASRAIRVGPTGPDDILPQLFDTYLFNDSVDKGVLGGIAVSLGDLHLIAGDVNGNALSYVLSQRGGRELSAQQTMTQVGLRRVVRRADRMEQAIGSYEGNANGSDVAELRLTAILMGVASRIGVASLAFVSSSETEVNERTNGSGGMTQSGIGDFGLSSLPDGRRSDLCNNLLQAIELMRESWMRRYHKLGFVQAVDEIVGRTLTKLSEGMPYQGFLEERRAEEWIPTDDY